MWDHSLEPPDEADWKSVLTDKTSGGGLLLAMLGRAVPEVGSNTALSQILWEKKANPPLCKSTWGGGGLPPFTKTSQKASPLPGHLEGGLEPR